MSDGTFTMEDGTKVMENPELPGNAIPVPSLREKLSRVAAHCAHIDKDGWNEFHRYHYVTAGAVFRAVNEALVANRLISVPSFKVTGSESFALVECRLEIRDLDSEEVLVTTAYGSGYDKGDKAVMKGQTAALKYAWMMLVPVSSGDDPEADSTTDSRAHGEPVKPRQTQEQYAERVQRNKTAPLSPEGVRLSEEINASLAEEKETAKKAGRMWPEPKVVLTEEEEQRRRFMEAVGGVEECPCGSPVIERHASKAKGGYPYLVCEASDKAFKAGTKLKGEHTWKRVP